MKRQNDSQSYYNFDNELLDLYIKDINRYPQLSEDEEKELARRAKLGDEEALNKLICGNLRFVVKTVSNFQGCGICMNDLISEGNIGLTIAAQRFDETKGNKFITYAVFWIKKQILQAISDLHGTIHLPQNKEKDLKKVREADDRLTAKLHRAPSLAELAEATGLPENKVANLRLIDIQGVPLDTFTTSEDGYCQESTLTLESYEQADKHLMNESLVKDVHRFLNTLPEIELKVLKARFGIDTLQELTTEEIGALLGYSREKIRQISNKAMKRLGKPSASGDLRQYLAA